MKLAKLRSRLLSGAVLVPEKTTPKAERPAEHGAAIAFLAGREMRARPLGLEDGYELCYFCNANSHGRVNRAVFEVTFLAHPETPTLPLCRECALTDWRRADFPLSDHEAVVRFSKRRAEAIASEPTPKKPGFRPRRIRAKLP